MGVDGASTLKELMPSHLITCMQVHSVCLGGLHADRWTYKKLYVWMYLCMYILGWLFYLALYRGNFTYDKISYGLKKKRFGIVLDETVHAYFK